MTQGFHKWPLVRFPAVNRGRRDLNAPPRLSGARTLRDRAR
jgi:hypothetical protein